MLKLWYVERAGVESESKVKAGVRVDDGELILALG
jgi:hypothetical protein